MKRLTALLLAVVMVLALCACGKSKEVQAVEAAISGIGELSYDKIYAVKEARGMYDALTSKDANNVENLSILEEAERKIETVDEFIDRMDEMADLLQDANFVDGIEFASTLETDYENMGEAEKTILNDMWALVTTDASIPETISAFKNVALERCVNNTYFALPQYVTSYSIEGAWLVNDHGDFAAYNTWFSEESQVNSAIEEYIDYISQFTEVSGSGYQFTFKDNDGNECSVLYIGRGVVQVRVPRF